MKFKLRLVRNDKPKIKVGTGIWQQLEKKGNIIPYSTGQFTMPNLSSPPKRTVKLMTNEAGMKLFQQALEKEANKKKENEYRKRFSLKSKIFKQTYKFG